MTFVHEDPQFELLLGIVARETGILTGLPRLTELSLAAHALRYCFKTRCLSCVCSRP